MFPLPVLSTVCDNLRIVFILPITLWPPVLCRYQFRCVCKPTLVDACYHGYLQNCQCDTGSTFQPCVWIALKVLFSWPPPNADRCVTLNKPQITRVKFRVLSAQVSANAVLREKSSLEFKPAYSEELLLEHQLLGGNTASVGLVVLRRKALQPINCNYLKIYKNKVEITEFLSPPAWSAWRQDDDA